MAATALVRDQIEGGEKLIRKLLQRGFPVVAALWAKREYDSQAYLYLVSPEVDIIGQIKSYQALSSAQMELEQEGLHWMEQIERFSVKLLPSSDPLAQGVLKRYRDFPNPRPSLPRDLSVDSEFVESAFIYPQALFQAAPVAP